jgi:murein DD-endopeptidase MepM/ murein hydrolase activator NlpD
MRTFLAFVVLVLLALGGIYVGAGRAAGPEIAIDRPDRMIGLASELSFTVAAPGGTLAGVEAVLEQEGQRLPLFSLADPGDAALQQETGDRVRITRPVGRRSVPELQPGTATLVVTASRPVLFGLRTPAATARRELEVRLDPPRLSVVSAHHHVNHGGAELVVYRVSPADVESGVRVGSRTFPGYPAAGAGIPGADDLLRVAFFALLYDEELKAPIELYAQDPAGNTARAAFEYRTFPRTFRRSRIEVDDRFLERVVPAIVEGSPGLDVPPAAPLLDQYLAVNRDLRQQNADTIAAFAAQTAPEMLWQGAFRQLGGSKVESGFADYRTYYYRGEEIDRQVHLGFDLAVTANVPVAAANRGRVLFADYLGIYGNCVIVDHGLGVQSLYAHLSSVDVSPGQLVDQGTQLGRSGMTGLAGGDHLHFTMLLQGHPVNPVEWWDPKWMQDRVLRKLQEAAPSFSSAPPVFLRPGGTL